MTKKDTGVKAQTDFNKKKEPISDKLPRYFLLIVLVVVAAVFGIANPRLYGLTGMTTIISTFSIQGIIALGLMMEMTTGNFDLAIGANAGFAAAVVGAIMSYAPPKFYIPAVIIGILAAMLVGGLNAFITVKIGVPAFIGTMAMRSVLSGLISYMTKNVTYFSKNWDNTFRFIGQSKIGGIIPCPLIFFVVICFATYLFLERSKTGRYIYATGANRTAALNVGIPVIKMQVLSFIIGGGLAAIGGILHSSRNFQTSVQMGLDLQLPAQICCLLGATFLTPGKYNVRGCIVGIVLTSIITNGVYSTIGSAIYIKSIIEGVTFMISIGLIAKIRKEGLPKVSFDI
ncbi:MAG: ABC transporter permease [Bacillota bacterium]|nr:ABC transporter permease [Bacillota bacterium]